jgi:hypothetical protein
VADEENYFFLQATVKRLDKTKKEQVYGVALDYSNKSVTFYSHTQIDCETEKSKF